MKLFQATGTLNQGGRFNTYFPAFDETTAEKKLNIRLPLIRTLALSEIWPAADHPKRWDERRQKFVSRIPFMGRRLASLGQTYTPEQLEVTTKAADSYRKGFESRLGATSRSNPERSAKSAKADLALLLRGWEAATKRIQAHKAVKAPIKKSRKKKVVEPSLF